MLTTHIRTMQMDDLTTVMALELAEYPFPWTYGIFVDCLRVGYSCWVLTHNETIIGYAVMSIAANECHILNLCITHTYQHQGYGQLLLQHLLTTARQGGVTLMLLEVRISNKRALSLYQQQGFNEIGIRKNYYPTHKGREDALVLARSEAPIKT